MLPQLPSPAAANEAAALLAGLTVAQVEAVTAGDGPLCILAGAGTGKTRVLTRRIAYRITMGSADATHVLALTFTRKAAAELGHRLGEHGQREQVVAGTFHAVAAAQLRRWWADRGRRPPVLLDRPTRLVAELAAARPAVRNLPAAELAAEIGWARARLVDPDQFESAAVRSGRRLRAPAADLAGLYERYETEKRKRGLVDFDDLLHRCADALETDAEFAAAQHWRWRHVFVDEFQDVNPLQHRLLLAWLGDHRDVCVVGDPNQAIYGWNGADPSLLAEVPTRWPGTTVVQLDDNFRCSPQVVAAGAAILGEAGTGLRSRRRDGPSPTIDAHPSELAEAAAVAVSIRRARSEGVPWSQMAVLVRTNAQAVPLLAALEAAGVPARASGRHGLLDHPACAALLAQLGAAPAAPVAVAAADLDSAARNGADGATDGGPGAPDADGARVALGALAELARDYGRLDDRGTVGGFLVWLRSAAGREPDGIGVADAVTVASFHRAKGLEWTAVWLCGIERGLVPFGSSPSDAAEAEERRLFYVALTRAERHLHLSWASRRTLGGRSVPREPSPWLSLLGAEGPEAADEPIDVETWRARVAEQRRRLRTEGRGPRPGSGGRSSALPKPDGEITGRLRTWRAAAARGAGVPAHVLLHDRTLAALATLRPTSIEALLEVPGLGPVKAARFGEALIALVASEARSA